MGSDLTAIRLIELIKKVARKTARNSSADMVIAEVTSLDPLEVDIGNNTRLTEEFLFLGQMCRPHKVTIPHTHLIDAFLTEPAKAITTQSISAGNATDGKPNTASYDIKTQDITRDDDKGTNKRELKTETKSNVDLGGASLKMSIDVTGSSVSDTGVFVGQGAYTPGLNDKVLSTNDLSTFSVEDDKHRHVVTEKTTQDVHFPDTDYEDSVEIEIYPRLKVGDKVLGFFFNSHQRLYIAERIEEADK